MSAHWLDVLPVLPLARGVPVRMRFLCLESNRWEDAYRNPSTAIDSAFFANRFERAPLADFTDEDVDDTRRILVDLDDPQGFIYALRYLQSLQYPTARYVGEALDDLLSGWLNGETTDADRLDVARRLRTTLAWHNEDPSKA